MIRLAGKQKAKPAEGQRHRDSVLFCLYVGEPPLRFELWAKHANREALSTGASAIVTRSVPARARRCAQRVGDGSLQARWCAVSRVLVHRVVVGWRPSRTDAAIVLINCLEVCQILLVGRHVRSHGSIAARHDGRWRGFNLQTTKEPSTRARKHTRARARTHRAYCIRAGCGMNSVGHNQDSIFFHGGRTAPPTRRARVRCCKARQSVRSSPSSC